MVLRSVVKLVLTSLLLVLTLAWTGVQAREQAASNATIALNELPAQGIETYQLIHQGGPFRSRRTA